MSIMKAISWFRRRLLVRVMVGHGVRIRAGDTVLVATDGFLANEEIAGLRSAFEANHPGVKLVFVAGLGRLTVLAGDVVGRERGANRADSGKGSGDDPMVRSPDSPKDGAQATE